MAWSRDRVRSEMGTFLDKYGRKAHAGHDPNDRGYDRHLERIVKSMNPTELDAMMRGETEDAGDFGCKYCADDSNRWYGHVDQLGSDARGMILLRCPECGSFYENTARGPDATRLLSADEARSAFPNANA